VKELELVDFANFDRLVLLGQHIRITVYFRHSLLLAHFVLQGLSLLELGMLVLAVHHLHGLLSCCSFRPHVAPQLSVVLPLLLYLLLVDHLLEVGADGTEVLILELEHVDPLDF